MPQMSEFRIVLYSRGELRGVIFREGDALDHARRGEQSPFSRTGLTHARTPKQELFFFTKKSFYIT